MLRVALSLAVCERALCSCRRWRWGCDGGETEGAPPRGAGDASSRRPRGEQSGGVRAEFLHRVMPDGVAAQAAGSASATAVASRRDEPRARGERKERKGGAAAATAATATLPASAGPRAALRSSAVTRGTAGERASSDTATTALSTGVLLWLVQSSGGSRRAPDGDTLRSIAGLEAACSSLRETIGDFRLH